MNPRASSLLRAGLLEKIQPLVQNLLHMCKLFTSCHRKTIVVFSQVAYSYSDCGQYVYEPVVVGKQQHSGVDCTPLLVSSELQPILVYWG